jgi:hypothetical protein
MFLSFWNKAGKCTFDEVLLACGKARVKFKIGDSPQVNQANFFATFRSQIKEQGKF